MIVTMANLQDVVNTLRQAERIGIDTETTGLRPFHGDRLFSIAMCTDVGPERHRFYFNFQDYPLLPVDWELHKNEVLPYLQEWLFSIKDILWFAHGAKFDLHMLAQDACTLVGDVWCTLVMGRVDYNAHNEYDLEASLERIGLEKDPAVEAYIEEHKLYEMVDVPGRKKQDKNKFYYLVPFEIISRYALIDAEGTFVLGNEQDRSIREQDAKTPEEIPKIRAVVSNEMRLTKTLQRIEANGCRIDRVYCGRAAEYTQAVLDAARCEMQVAVGREYKSSAKFHADLFKGHEHEFSTAEKGGLSFDKDALKKITHPMVPALLRYRVAQNRLSFYNGFLYHADKNDRIHTSLNAAVVKHGRLSSSGPNLQNLKKDAIEDFSEAELEKDFFVRRAIIPSEGNVFLMPDYEGMEYRMLLNYACEDVGYMVNLAKLMLGGLNFHRATVQLCKDTGYDLEYKKAKSANFLTGYEGGAAALAVLIGCTETEAREIQAAINRACPEAKRTRTSIINTAKRRGFVYNWLGRRCHFPNPEFGYRGPNYVISGGCAEIMKIGMNNFQDWLDRSGSKALLVLTIHDELVVDCPRGEAPRVARALKHFMEGAYKAKWLPFTISMEWSDKSMFDKVAGYPPEEMAA